MCYYKAHKQTHIGCYDVNHQETMNPTQRIKELLPVCVFIASVHITVVMYDVCRKAQRGKKRKTDESSF